MVRVFMVYESEPDPERYEQHAELCRKVPDSTFRHGRVFGAPLGPGPWNRSSFRRQLEHARALRGNERLAAYRRIEDELMRAAPFAVFGSRTWSQYFSPKVGCKLFQGEYGFVDLGALCKK